MPVGRRDDSYTVHIGGESAACQNAPMPGSCWRSLFSRYGAPLLGWVLTAALLEPACAVEPVQVGSKRFTESYVLGEIVRQTLLAQGIAAVHKQGLGNTGILE